MGTSITSFGRTLTRFGGFALIVLGSVGLTTAYARWTDARTRVAILTEPATQPSNGTSLSPRSPSSSEISIQTVRPARRTLAQRSAGRKTSTRAPSMSNPASKSATSEHLGVIAAQRKMAWSAGSFFAGLVLVTFSLYERPPVQPRSGADEMLSEKKWPF
ncbi:MAG: hypothetical protein ABIP55_13710 [Tepidisphaeraceae bacterium]